MDATSIPRSDWASCAYLRSLEQDSFLSFRRLLKLHPTEVREAYVNRMTKLTKSLRDRCGARFIGIDWVDVDVAQGVLPCADILPHEANGRLAVAVSRCLMPFFDHYFD